jgi:hypothetical protein
MGKRVFGAKEIVPEKSIDQKSKNDLLPDDADSLELKAQKKLANERYRQDTDERKLLSHWVMFVVSVWLLLVFAILIMTGCMILDMSDTVLCVLLGTTTINILGLAYIVLQGLFPESKSKSKKK